MKTTVGAGWTALPTRRERKRAQDPSSVPLSAAGEADLVLVDTTWGVVQPMEPVRGVRTIGELELVDLLARGAALIDTRVNGSLGGETIRGSVNIAHDQIAERRSELDPGRVSIMFCNGPQCPQTPNALTTLVDAGYPAAALAYYRGGMHDWVTLAFPTQPI